MNAGCAAPSQPQVKDAKVVFIPKSGKPLRPANLGPISLTSCVGKLMEHVLQTRLSRYLIDAKSSVSVYVKKMTISIISSC